MLLITIVLLPDGRELVKKKKLTFITQIKKVLLFIRFKILSPMIFWYLWFLKNRI